MALRAAREHFALCSRSACPVPLRSDCADALGAIMRDLPSIVPGARRADGSDIGNLSIFVDGNPMAAEPGASLHLDPGSHVVRIESAGYRPSSTEIVLRVGERNRPVFVTLERGDGDDRSPFTGKGARRSPLIWPLAGLGVVAMGSFAYFGVSGMVDRAGAIGRCPGGTCPHEDEANVRTQFIIADISLAVGVLALAGAAILFFKDSGAKAP